MKTSNSKFIANLVKGGIALIGAAVTGVLMACVKAVPNEQPEIIDAEAEVVDESSVESVKEVTED